MADEAPKIQIDSDWKKQAQAEKERLAAQMEGRPAGPPAAPAAEPVAQPAPGAAQAAEQPEQAPAGTIPPASFEEIIATLGTQAFMFLGEVPEPSSGQAVVSLPLAKHYIDLLAVLEQKTRGHLDADEKRQLDQVLYEARMRYVQLAGGMGTFRPRPRGQGTPDLKA